MQSWKWHWEKLSQRLKLLLVAYGCISNPHSYSSRWILCGRHLLRAIVTDSSERCVSTWSSSHSSRTQWVCYPECKCWGKKWKIQKNKKQRGREERGDLGDQLNRIKQKKLGAWLRSFQSTWPAPEEDAWDCGQWEPGWASNAKLKHPGVGPQMTANMGQTPKPPKQT